MSKFIETATKFFDGLEKGIGAEELKGFFVEGNVCVVCVVVVCEWCGVCVWEPYKPDPHNEMHPSNWNTNLFIYSVLCSRGHVQLWLPSSEDPLWICWLHAGMLYKLFYPFLYDKLTSFLCVCVYSTFHPFSILNCRASTRSYLTLTTRYRMWPATRPMWHSWPLAGLVFMKRVLISSTWRTPYCFEGERFSSNLDSSLLLNRALILVKADQFLCLILQSRLVVLTATRWPSTRKASSPTCTRCLTSSLPFLSWAGHCLALSKTMKPSMELLPFEWEAFHLNLNEREKMLNKWINVVLL